MWTCPATCHMALLWTPLPDTGPLKRYTFKERTQRFFKLKSTFDAAKTIYVYSLLQGNIQCFNFGISWYPLLVNFSSESNFIIMFLLFHGRKCLFAHSVCGRSGLFAHTLCGRSGLFAHSPGFFCLVIT